MRNRQNLLVSFLLLCFSIFATVSLIPAQVTYSSGFQVQNLSAVQANISIQYYNKDGSSPATGGTVTDTVPANGSKSYKTIHPGSPFDGSVVISADQQIIAIANTMGAYSGNAEAFAASTSSFSSGSTTVNLPLVMKNNYGYNTWFNVQNTGTADATVTVTFSSGVTQTASVKPGAAATFDQSANTQLPSTAWVGSAKVTSTQPIIATVMQVGTDAVKTMLGYNGFLDGAKTISLPLIMANNYGWYTGIQIQNIGTAATHVTVTYSANTAGTFQPAAETCSNLLPGTSCTLGQYNNGQWGSGYDANKRYEGSATITNSAAQNLVAIVNQACRVGQSGCGLASMGSAYEGFSSGATTTISAPLIMANNFNYYTGIQVQNVGTANCNLSVAYGANTGGTFAPTAEAASNIVPGASAKFLQRGGQWGTYPATDNSKLYVGSAVITGAGSGCSIIAIVNQINPSAAGDQAMTYDGFNY